MTIHFRYLIFLLVIFVFLNSCQTYRQNILFTTGEDFAAAAEPLIREAENTYILQPFDYIQIEIYTNKGERLIDPNFELVEENMRNQVQQRPVPTYLVREDGEVNLPIVGLVKVAGLTLAQTDSVLVEAYSEYYKEPYVLTQYTNKRVIVLGAMGGQVVPLTNENMSVIEVIALVGGISNDARGHNIRLLRGDLNNPSVHIIDLTTIQGLRKAELKVQPGDIIYIEPVRKIVSESVRDIAPLLSVITSLFTILVLARNF